MMDETNSPPLNILVVDDEINIRRTLTICLETEGHNVVAVSNERDAVSQASQRSFDAAFVDLRLGVTDGLDLIPRLLATTPWLKIVVITAYASIQTAVEAIKRGATEYLPKPFTPGQVKLAVQKINEVRRLEQKITALQEDLKRLNPDMDFSTASPVMEKTIELACQVAPSDASILLRGESGTGKSMLARAIHAWSNRRSKTLATISCPALSPELLESELFGHTRGAFTGAIREYSGRVAACDGGTLFLDEIGDLPLSVQPKLLRLIQERVYEHVGDYVTHTADVRIITATNIDLETAVMEGRFREDLLYRLNVIQIRIPALRERPEDIIPLAERLLVFFARASHRTFSGFTEEAIQALGQYHWPGNVRELRNVVERAAILCRTDRVGVEYLSEKVSPVGRSLAIGDPVSLERIEEEHLRSVLATARSLQEAAEILGIDQSTLWRKRRQYNI